MAGTTKSRLLSVAAFLTVGISLMLGNAGCCPDGTFPPCTVVNGPTTLVNETFFFTPINRNFNPSAAGKTINVTVSGDVTASRITVAVTDLATANVVAGELLPTTNSTTVSFVSTNNGAHAVSALDIGTSPSSVYTVLVTEQ